MRGWEPEESTRFEYDDGRLVRSVVTKDPEWDDEQLNLMLAWQALHEDIGSHGQLMSEATDPANEGRFVAEAVTDHAQAARDKMREQYKKDFPDDPQHGVFFVARKRD